MADIITPESPHIERPYGYKTWRVQPEALTGSPDVMIVTLPAGNVHHGCASLLHPW